jgi:hypothetical protein
MEYANGYGLASIGLIMKADLPLLKRRADVPLLEGK